MRSQYGSIPFFILCVVTLPQRGVFGDGPLECTYKHTHYTCTKYSYSKDPKVKDLIETEHMANVDFIFKLSCQNLIATVTYDNHILDKFKVASCDKDSVTQKLFVEKRPDQTVLKDERYLPTSVKIYYIKYGGKCYEKKYYFNNWLLKTDILRDAGEIMRSTPLEHQQCQRDNSLQAFTNCKSVKFLSYNVFHVEYEAKGSEDWYPSSLTLYPSSDSTMPHVKLLACSYKTDKFLFKLLCIKIHGQNGAAAYVGEEDPRSVFMDRFAVTSCQEDHIVNSIFPPNYDNGRKPAAGPTHVIKYAYYRETCMQRNYKNAITGRSVKDRQPSNTACPSENDVSIGRWTDCQGPLKSPSAIDLTGK